MICLYLHTCGRRRNVHKLKTRYNQGKIACLILSGIKNLPIAFNFKLNMRGRCELYLLWARCSNLFKIMKILTCLLKVLVIWKTFMRYCNSLLIRINLIWVVLLESGERMWVIEMFRLWITTCSASIRGQQKEITCLCIGTR